MARVEIKPHGGTTAVFIDGMEQENVTGYSVKPQVGMEHPLVVLEYGHKNDYLFKEADIQCKMHSESLQEAAEIVRNEFLQHGDWYNALVKSIMGYLMETQGNARICDIAEGLAKRLIGDEEYGTD